MSDFDEVMDERSLLVTKECRDMSLIFKYMVLSEETFYCDSYEIEPLGDGFFKITMRDAWTNLMNLERRIVKSAEVYSRCFSIIEL
jgi:hypothetical protein